MILFGKNLMHFSDLCFIAEISCNHNGDISRAHALIEAAKECGADAVKIQCYSPDSLTLNDGYVGKGKTPWEGETLYELYKRTATPLDWIEPLFEHAKKVGIPIFSSVFDELGLDILERVNCPVYKIASFEANDPNFIKKVASKNKPLIISTGTLSEQEIYRAYKASDQENVILMHCISSYPCELKNLGLRKIDRLEFDYSVHVGFSCHCDNMLAIPLAAAHGAKVIEFHLLLGDRADRDSEDFTFSYTPSMFKDVKQLALDAIWAVQNKRPDIENGVEFRRSLFVVEDIKAGELFTEHNVKSLRPNLGCEPYLLPNIIGRTAAVDIPKNTPMHMELIR